MSLSDLLVFFIPPLSTFLFSASSSTPHLCSVPIEICKHNSLGNRIERFMKESVFGLGVLCCGNPYQSPVNKIYVLKVNWNYHIETIRENYAEEKLNEQKMRME